MQIQSTIFSTKIYSGKCKPSLWIKMVDKVAANAALMPVECRAQIKHGRRQLSENRKGNRKNIKKVIVNLK